MRSGLAGDTVNHGKPANSHASSRHSFGRRHRHRAGRAGTRQTSKPAPQFPTDRTSASLPWRAQLGSGRLAWVRGSLSSTITNAYLPQPDDPKQRFQAECLMRYMLAKFGYEIRVEGPPWTAATPLVLVARSNNGFFFSGYCPSTAVALRLRFPHGAPHLHGYETWLENGHSSYTHAARLAPRVPLLCRAS